MKTDEFEGFKEFEFKNPERVIGGNGPGGDIDKDKIKMPGNGEI